MVQGLRIGSDVKLEGYGDRLSLRGLFDGEFRVVPAGVRPYAFSAVKDSKVKMESCSLRSVFGKPVYRFEADSPIEIERIRNRIGMKKTFEADIAYIRRLLVDRRFGVDYEGRNVFLDLELDDRKGVPVTYGDYEILCVGYSFGDGVEYLRMKDEEEMLRTFLETLIKERKTVLIGWNVGFDFEHLKERAKRFGIEEAEILDYVHLLDLRDMYKAAVKGLSSYSLHEASKHEGLVEKKREKKVSMMSEAELEEYNRHDVELTVQIDGKYRFVETYERLAQEMNLLLNMTSAWVVGDTLLLRRLRELGYVAPNVEKHSRSGYEGAIVFEPKPGVQRNVAIIDVTSLYPNVIIDKKIDVYGFKGEVLPYLEKKLLDLRKNAKSKVEKEVFKLMGNSLYGMLGYVRSRFYDVKKAQAVTAGGREVIVRMAEIIRRLGLEVLYGDTDSVFVEVRGIENPAFLVDYVNEKITPYVVKLDAVLSKVLFFGRKGKGLKKRYIGIESDGELRARGVELRRGDWCELSKRVLREAVLMIFDGKSREEVMKYMLNVERRMRSGEFDAELPVTKTVRMEKYEKEPPHARAYREAVESGLISGDTREITFLYVDGKPVAFREGLKPDYRYYWEHQIMPPVKRLLESLEEAEMGKMSNYMRNDGV